MKKLPLLLLLFPLICSAEVMDKEFSFSVVLLFALVGSISAYFSARYRPWLLLIVLPFLGLLAFAHLSEVNDSFVGPAMATEAGGVYILFSWLSPLLILALTVCGLFLRGRHAKVNT
jgi:hypothetical protein